MEKIKVKTSNLIKILMIMFIILLIMNTVSVCSSDKIINPDDYDPGDLTGGDKMLNIGNTIIGIVQLLGSGVSIIVLIVIGIQYMLGSIEERAEYKEKMMPYIIGAIMLFGITNILAFISNIASDI